jgi:hypothetical protein
VSTLIERLRNKLVVVPKPGTERRSLQPHENITFWFGGEHKAGDSAGLRSVGIGGQVQEHVYAVDPLCEEAAQTLEGVAPQMEVAHLPSVDEKFVSWAKGHQLNLAREATGEYASETTYEASESFKAAVVWCRSGPTKKCFQRFGEVDCDAPFCGCNPAWSDAIELLQECGWKSPDKLRAAPPPGGEQRVLNVIDTAQRLTKLSNPELVAIAIAETFADTFADTSHTAMLVLHEMCSRLHPGWADEAPEEGS